MKRHHSASHWHRGLRAIHFGSMAGLLAVTFLGALLMTVTSPLWTRPATAAVSGFAPTSFWNKAVPAYTTLHPDSGQIVSDISRQVARYGTKIDTDYSSAPVYIADPSTPVVSVIPWDCGAGLPSGLATQWQAVPLPGHAVPGGVQAEMVVYQPSSATVWEFGQMRRYGNQWQACTGGRTSTASDGTFASPYGVSASGLAVLAAQLGVQELRTGHINHVIGLRLPEVNGWVSPATQAPAARAPGAPAMGTRLRLDPAVNVASLGLSPPQAAIARAAQTYGFVVWDTGPTVGFTAENPLSYTSRGLANPYLDILQGDLSRFPWDKLQAMPAGQVSSGDIPAITQFTASSQTVRADNRVTLRWQANNVNRCLIPGVASDLPASGSVLSRALTADTVFVLRCGGPGGVTTSQVAVRVVPLGSNDPLPSLSPAVIIDLPYAGFANILPELMSAESAAQVYKVVYYEQSVYLYETAKPPFALNTNRMDNGKYTVEARIFYRDGRSEQRTAGITVNNSPETLFAVTQSGPVVMADDIPAHWAIVGMVIVFTAMAVGTRWGYRRASKL